MAVRIPENYRPLLDVMEMQEGISLVKTVFASEFSAALRLRRVSAPLFVPSASGLNDDLGSPRPPVEFSVPALCANAQVVQSLAKWKRLALKRYGFTVGTGLYTDMNAIRPGEDPDLTHSVYVDQWDWEKIIAPEDRTLGYLMDVVRTIVRVIRATDAALLRRFPHLTPLPDRNVSFITAQALEDRYPSLSSADRETAYVREHPIACILQIGEPLRSGFLHGCRAPDYDDWRLNCDILVWNGVLSEAMELSSMGIRVDAAGLARQLHLSGREELSRLPFHQMLLQGQLPLTIGGGIGQSRLCMYLMGCAHIGQVQCGIWDRDTLSYLEKYGIVIL